MKSNKSFITRFSRKNRISIQNNSSIIITIILSIFLFSCRSSRELIYMNNLNDNEILSTLNDSLTEYIIKAGDILYVSIKSMNADVNALFDPEMSGSQSYNSTLKFSSPQGAYLYGFEVDDAGTINLPMLGKVKVAGNNQKKAELIVLEKAMNYLNDAVVKVKLLNYKVTVLGEVNSPGVYYNYNKGFTLFEAIAMANGNTDFANIRNVVVLRRQPEGIKTIKLDLSSKEIWSSEAFYLYPNDYIFVEPDKYKNFKLNSQAYSLFFSSVSIILALIGFLV